MFKRGEKMKNIESERDWEECHKCHQCNKDWHECKCDKCDDNWWDCPKCHNKCHKDWHKCPKCNHDFHHDCCDCWFGSIMHVEKNPKISIIIKHPSGCFSLYRNVWTGMLFQRRSNKICSEMKVMARRLRGKLFCLMLYFQTQISEMSLKVGVSQGVMGVSIEQK